MATVSLAAGESKLVSVTFDAPYAVAPRVEIHPVTTQSYVQTFNIYTLPTTTGFAIGAINNGNGSPTDYIYWKAYNV